jgi:hypothetical protein
LLNAIGGRLDVVSTLGAGTEFVVHVPSLADDVAPRPPASTGPALPDADDAHASA